MYDAGERKHWLKLAADGLVGVGRDVAAAEVKLLLHKLGMPLS